MAHSPALIPELMVSNYAQSLAFYTQLAGFSVVYDRPEESFAMLVNPCGARLMIEGITATGRLWTVGDMQQPYGRGINLQIEVEDAEALLQRFLHVHHPIYLPLEEKWYRWGAQETGNRQFIVQDPDGYLLRFFQDLGLR